MDHDWAADHLQVIRTLMERAALYRRALAPIMLMAGGMGIAAAAAGYALRFDTPRSFTTYWMAVSLVTLLFAFLLVRRQALKADEPFWSPPTRRVTQALVPPLFVGMMIGEIAWAASSMEVICSIRLPTLWVMLYGCALHAAGFFMERGIRLFGWVVLLAGTVLACAGQWLPWLWQPRQDHLVMGAVFGAGHLAYGLYLYFTESRNPS